MKVWSFAILIIAIVGCKETSPPKAIEVPVDQALNVKIVTFNIRREGDPDAGWQEWSNRISRVVTTLREIDADVIGIQEAQHGQAADLRASLPDYNFYGHGRDDGNRAGEYTCLLWKADRFEVDLLECGTFWLSDTPERAGSASWGNSAARATTWARLFDRHSARGFYVFNTHLDHQSQRSRELAVMLIAERIDQRSRLDEPIALIGDFNATEQNPAMAYLQGEQTILDGKPRGPWVRGLRNALSVAERSLRDRGTLHLWQGRKGPRWRVDHILLSEGVDISNPQIGRFSALELHPSDHHPVSAVATWNN